MIVLKICCKERVIELIKSIKNLWYEIYRDENKEFCISFGSDNGVVIYWHCGLPSEIKSILKEIR